MLHLMMNVIRFTIKGNLTHIKYVDTWRFRVWWPFVYTITNQTNTTRPGIIGTAIWMQISMEFRCIFYSKVSLVIFAGSLNLVNKRSSDAYTFSEIATCLQKLQHAFLNYNSFDWCEVWLLNLFCDSIFAFNYIIFTLFIIVEYLMIFLLHRSGDITLMTKGKWKIYKYRK